MKKSVRIFLSLALILVMLTASASTVFASSGMGVRHNLRTTIKVGESVSGSPDDNVLTFYGLDPSKGMANPYMEGASEFYDHFNGGHLGGGSDGDIGADGTMDYDGFYSYYTAYIPGKMTLRPMVQYLDSSWDPVGAPVPAGGPINFVIEEPKIETNLPATAKPGETVVFATAMTNIVAENYDITYVLVGSFEDRGFTCIRNDIYGHKIIYQPTVEVIEGKNIVKQAEQDYTYSLSTYETLTFTGTGTVKLKVTYHQIVTCPDCMGAYDADWNITGYRTYDPETIFTITVSDGTTKAPETKAPETKAPETKAPETKAPETKAPETTAPVTEAPEVTPTETEAPVETPETDAGTAPLTEAVPSTEIVSDTSEPAEDTPSLSDEKTGITVSGNLPEGATLSAAALSSGDDYDRAKTLLSDTAERFSLYDISIADAAGANIQPDGAVEVSLPLPAGFSDSVAVYRVEDDDTLTKLDSRREDGRIIFRTEHFSLYAVAELPAVAAEASAFPVWGIVLVVLAVVVAAAAVVVIILLKKKRA